MDGRQDENDQAWLWSGTTPSISDAFIATFAFHAVVCQPILEDVWALSVVGKRACLHEATAWTAVWRRRHVSDHSIDMVLMPNGHNFIPNYILSVKSLPSVKLLEMVIELGITGLCPILKAVLAMTEGRTTGSYYCRKTRSTARV